jgi:hypothetical protein
MISGMRLMMQAKTDARTRRTLSRNGGPSASCPAPAPVARLDRVAYHG